MPRTDHWLVVLALLAAGRVANGQEAPWTGSAQCELSVQTPNYAHEEIQTWTITGPPKQRGAMQVYPGSWSVVAEGNRRDLQGEKTARTQWTANVPPMAAPLVVFIRASDKKLIVKSDHSQLRSNTAGTLTQGVATSTFAEYEWQFPLVQDSVASTRVSGSSSDDVTAGIGPMQPAGLPGKAVCKWSFSKGAVPPISPQLTQRLSSLGSSLEPAARAWVTQQARAVAEQPQPDAAQVEADARLRFVSSNGGAPNIEDLVALVFMQAKTDGDEDLRQLLEEMEMQRVRKEQLNGLIQEVEREASAGKTNQTDLCITRTCQSLAVELAKLSDSTPKISKPFSLATTAGPSYQELPKIASQLEGARRDLDGLAGQSEARMRKFMDQKANLEQVLANILKRMSDTNSQIISNIK